MHEQTAALLHPGVPAPEITGAVRGIGHVAGQQPLEVDAVHLADRPAGDKLLEPGDKRHEAVVERHRDLLAGRLLRVQDGAAAGGIGRHRLLDDHIAAGLERLDRIRAVIGIDGRDNDAVRARLGQHVRKIAKDRQAAGQIGENLGPSRVDVVNAQDSAFSREVPFHGLGIHVQGPVAGSGKDIRFHDTPSRFRADLMPAR